MIEYISSAQNPKIKKLLALQQKSSERRSEGLFVVEGRRELEHCIEVGYEVDSVFYCPDIIGRSADPAVDFPKGAKLFEVSAFVYDKIAYRAGTEGVIAEVRTRSMSLEDLNLGKNPLIIVLESVEKPVIVCDPLTDLYNPNLIRSSIGAIFTVPCVACSSAECIDFLKERGIKIFTAQLQDSKLYYDTDFRGGSAIVMGTESTGLTDIWRKAADAHIRIPMLGRLDSLNVSVSAAILLFEAVRQRNG